MNDLAVELDNLDLLYQDMEEGIDEVPYIPEIDFNEAADRLWNIRDRKRELAAEEKILTKEFDDLKKKLISKMKENKLTTLGTGRSRVTLTSKPVTKLDPDGGWDIFIEYVLETGYTHLLTKNISATACKEHITVMGEELPGVTVRDIDDLSITTVKQKG